MNGEYLTSTVSTCSVCGRLLPAQVWLRQGAVWFDKRCPEHGAQSVRIWSDAAQYLELGRFHRAGSVPLRFATSVREGCPTDCGLCPEHEQHVCMPILEITDHCDMACPVCLVKTPGSFHLDRRQVAGILDGLIASEGQIDVLNLSGGEPTLNPHFRPIVEECLSRKEILYVSVSTNGRRLARDEGLLRFLAERRVILSLQFDGCDEGGYRAMRGGNLAEEKRQLVERGGKAGARMSLTVTAARGINDGRLKEAIELLFAHEHILSVMIQPMAYVGRGEAIPRPADALNIPDVLRAVDGACGGRVSAGDFSPLPCSHPACFSLAFYLKVDEGEFVPVKKLLDTERYLDMVQNRALLGTDAQSFEGIKDAVYDLWSGPSGLAPDSQKAIGAVRRILDAINCRGGYCGEEGVRNLLPERPEGCCAQKIPDPFFSAAERSMKSIFIHHFMDRHTFDLSRARKCCQVYPQPDGRLMPACVYNCLRR